MARLAIALDHKCDKTFGDRGWPRPRQPEEKPRMLVKARKAKAYLQPTVQI